MTRTTMSTQATEMTRAQSVRSIFANFGISPRFLVIALLVVGLVLFFNQQSDGAFLTERNLSQLLRQASVTAIAAVGVAMLMILGEIDLSIGSSVYLCGVFIVLAQQQFDVGILGSIGISILAGLLIGLWQGMWVVWLRIPAFIATLAGFLAFRAIGLVITGAQSKSVDPVFSNLTEATIPTVVVIVLLGLGALVVAMQFRGAVGRVGAGRQRLIRLIPPAVVGVAAVLVLLAMQLNVGLPTALLWIAGVTVAMWFFMKRTVFGRNSYAVGANRDAARYAGIPVKRYIFGSFVVMGVIYGIAACVLASRLGAVGPQTGLGLELDAIAAAVIGGVSLQGGRGSVVAALGGALLLSVIDNGLIFMDNLDANWQPAIKAFILLVAVAVDLRFQRNRN